MHKQMTGNCAQCHTPQAWKPATFDHNKYFPLDKNHNATCVTCHTSNNYKQYTCYGCHEHTPANMQAKHREEGVSDLDNCVRCHRSASGEHEGKGNGERDKRQRESD
jgi:mono/diheme cytochrome c family protein